jgi:hypothetical protein
MPNIYTEYNDERVKQLIELSKKDFPHVAEYMMFLMCVDYHCREEVGMDSMAGSRRWILQCWEA